MQRCATCRSNVGLKSKLLRGTSDEAVNGFPGLTIHRIKILACIYDEGHEAFCIGKLHRTLRTN